jgi:hypothetical protein
MRNVAAATLALLVGCDEEASVGSTRCTAANSCQALVVETPLSLTSIGTRDLPTLEPAWGWDGEPLLRYATVGVASASDGGVWLFGSEAGALVAHRMDAAGTLLGEQRVAAPVPNTRQAMVRTIDSHPLGPTLSVLWLTDDCDRPTLACEKPELLVFANDLATPVTRIDASTLYRSDQSVEAAYRSQDGQMLFIPTLADGFKAIDLRGKQLWTQPLPRELAKNDILLAMLGAPDQSAALDANGALVLNVNWFWEDDDQTSATWRGVLFRQPADGSKGLVLQYTVPSSGDVFRLRQGFPSFYAQDTRGRHVVAHELEDGDVAVLRLDGASAEGFRLTRDDSAELSIDGTAMDPAGNFHIVLNGNGSYDPLRRPILCTFPLDGAPSCVHIANHPGRMQAPAPGVVFIQGPGGFSRYER